MAVTILRVYPEPTQWAADVDLDGVRVQLTFQQYPAAGPAPDEATIKATAQAMLDAADSAYELVTEGGDAV